MKKKFIAAMAVAVVAVVAGYNVYSSQKSTDTLSDLALSKCGGIGKWRVGNWF